MSEDGDSSPSRTPIPGMEPAHQQCHVLDPDDEATTLCGLSGGPLLILISEEDRTTDITCPICRHRAVDLLEERDGAMNLPPGINFSRLLAVFGVTGFASAFFFSLPMSLLLALAALLVEIFLTPTVTKGR